MGGKTWSKDEELVFWKELIPHSPKRLGEDRVQNEEKPWEWVAEEMERRLGNKARRDYTHLGVFEHYFQNACLGRFSPNAGRLPLKYWRHEQALKRQREEEAAAAAADASAATTEASSADQASTSAESPAETNTSDAVASASNTENKAPPSADAAALANCQFSPPSSSSYLLGRHPTIPPHLAVPRPLPPNFTTPRVLMPPQYYLDRFLANHDRVTSTEVEDDGLFVNQSAGSWMDGGVASRGYDYYR